MLSGIKLMLVTFYRCFDRVRFIDFNEFLKPSEISLPFEMVLGTALFLIVSFSLLQDART